MYSYQCTVMMKVTKAPKIVSIISGVFKPGLLFPAEKKIINGMRWIIYGIVTASFSFKIPANICLLTNVCRNYKTSNYIIFQGFISKNTNQIWVADLLECTCINKITCMLPRHKLWYPRSVNEILQIYRFTHFFLFQVT